MKKRMIRLAQSQIVEISTIAYAMCYFDTLITSRPNVLLSSGNLQQALLHSNKQNKVGEKKPNSTKIFYQPLQEPPETDPYQYFRTAPKPPLLQCPVTKYNIRAVAAACVLLALKFNEGTHDCLKKGIAPIASTFEVSVSTIFEREMAVYACLQFNLLRPVADVMRYFPLIFDSCDEKPHTYFDKVIYQRFYAPGGLFVGEKISSFVSEQQQKEDQLKKEAKDKQNYDGRIGTNQSRKTTRRKARFTKIKRRKKQKQQRKNKTKQESQKRQNEEEFYEQNEYIDEELDWGDDVDSQNSEIESEEEENEENIRFRSYNTPYADETVQNEEQEEEEDEEEDDEEEEEGEEKEDGETINRNRNADEESQNSSDNEQISESQRESMTPNGPV
ncbi:MAG: hypothetical protein EZS28_020978 [Streblomastix strix]|uniref:Cyclin N-terminal domain-containing protein n=1 Tax=Streblomastix strix TaxID=222440 RepID=A0A5J4VM26_9EUKA|nr:MAG: hypothetical protein EZS28_020978 [Streblomastix strix]